MSRVLRLTLSPDLVEAVLDGRRPEGIRLDDLLGGFPLEWEGKQRLNFTVDAPREAT